jgi:hypothetical protein
MDVLLGLSFRIGQAERQLTEISDGVGVGTYDPNYSAIFVKNNS